MKEKAEPECAAVSQAASGQQTADTDTTPEAAADGITIPVKFNKEIRRLTADEAAQLAQKGLKFDLISGDYERIRQIAGRSGHSVSEFLNGLEENQHKAHRQELLEKCGGNEELAEHILTLEDGMTGEKSPGFAELQEQFPEIAEPSQLPGEVLEASSAKGTALLDEYLRYRLKKQREIRNAEKTRESASAASIGSQRHCAAAGYDPANTEFIRGIWGR